MRQMSTPSGHDGDTSESIVDWKCLDQDIVETTAKYQNESKKGRTYTNHLEGLDKHQLESMRVGVQDIQYVANTLGSENQILQYKLTSTNSNGGSFVAYVDSRTAVKIASSSPDGGVPMLLQALMHMQADDPELKTHNPFAFPFVQHLKDAFPQEEDIDSYKPTAEHGAYPDGRKIYPISTDYVDPAMLCIQSTTRTTKNNKIVKLCTVRVINENASTNVSYTAMQTATITWSSGIEQKQVQFSQTMVMSCIGATRVVKHEEMNTFFPVPQLTPFCMDHEETPRTSVVHLFTNGKHFTAVVEYIGDNNAQTIHLPLYAMVQDLENRQVIPKIFASPTDDHNTHTTYMETIYTDPSIPMVVMRKSPSPTVALFELFSVMGRDVKDQDFVNDAKVFRGDSSSDTYSEDDRHRGVLPEHELYDAPPNPRHNKDSLNMESYNTSPDRYLRSYPHTPMNMSYTEYPEAVRMALMRRWKM